MEYLKGSEWKKWDLHIHSNASDGTGTPKEILEKANEKGISVIALTDHHTVKNIDEIKKLSKDYNVNVITGIEFRTEYGSSSVHMIGLFPDNHNGIELDTRALNDLILSRLGISETIIIAKGREAKKDLSDEEAFKEGMFLVQVDFKNAATLIREYGGVVSVHAGNKSNSFEAEMKHKGSSKKNVKELYDSLGTLKEELLKNYIDICEISKGNDNEKFYLEGFNKPSIISSDAHKKDDVGNKFSWIKAEPTFEGLRQVLIEPSERVKIQSEMPDEKDSYNIIEKVKFIPKAKSNKFSSEWIEINKNLNAIIGGKSSGKSLLLYFIAKTLGTEIDSDYINYSNEQLEIDDFIVCFKDGKEFKMSEKSGKRPVVYIPQLYLNELADKNREDLEKLLLNNLLEKDGVESRKQYFKEQNIAIEKEVQNSIIDLFDTLEIKIKEQNEVKQYPEKKAINDNLDKLKLRRDRLIRESRLSEEENKIYLVLKKEQIKLSEDIRKITIDKWNVDNVPFWLSELVPKNKIDYFYDFNFRINIECKEDKEEIFKKIMEHYTYMKNWEKELLELSKKYSKKYGDFENELKLKLDKNLEEQKKYSEKIETYAEIEKINLIIEEDEKKYRKIEKHLEKVRILEEGIIKILEKIKDQLYKRYKNYENIVELLNKNGHVNEKLQIITKIDFNEDIFNENISSIFNLKQNLKETIGDFFINNIYQYNQNIHVENVLIIGNKVNVDEEIKLKIGKSKKDLWNELLKDNYKISYTLKENEDDLHQMSPGKKGIILFKLFLEQKNPKYPILVDQPEDNLDNRTVYNELIDFIKSKKKERQIIMVTHNANLVVSTDAEEIIVANQSGENNTGENKKFKFEYVSGALENSYENNVNHGILYQKGIKEHVCEILEGGEEAFKKREKSYRIKR